MCESKLASHKTFERFCELRGIRAGPIQRAATPTPDYKVWIGPKGYIVELKQLDPNVEDERQRRELETTGQTAGEVLTGKRARNKVGKAKRQLAPSARRGVPTLLVLFDNTGAHTLGVHIDPYAIEAAMYEKVPGGKPTISAVGVLFPYHPDDPCKAPYLVLYHSEFADVPLDPRCVAAVTEYQYRRQDGHLVHAITGQRET